MNINGINFKHQPSVVLNNQQQANPFFAGNTFSARVVGQDQGKFLMEIIGGGSFTTSFNGQQPQIGEVMDFEVVSVGEQVAVKLAKKHAQGSIKDMSSEDILDLFKQSNFVKEVSDASDTETKRAEEIALKQALKTIKNSLEQTENQLSVSAINKLLSQGIPIGQLDIAKVQSYLAEVVPDEVAQSNKAQGQVAQTLDKYQLPYTQHNINALNKVVETFVESTQLTDQQLAMAMKQEGLTLEGLYKTKHSAHDYYPVKPPIDGFEDKLRQLFEKAGIATSEENLKAGKLFFEQDLDITAANLDKLTYLKNLGGKAQQVLDQGAYHLKHGESLVAIDLFALPDEPLTGGYVQLVEDIKGLTPQHVDQAMAQDLPMTLASLKEVQVPQEAGYTQDHLAYKRQLAEIQAKLTYEAVYRLAHKNIDINTLPIDQALAELKALDTQNYVKSLTHAGVAPEQLAESAKTMTKLYDSLESTKTPFYQGALIKQEIAPTLSAIDEKVLAEKKLKGYEAFMTVPNSKYGDSFVKVKDQLADVLAGIGMEATEENVRVASILSRSQMDVTYEHMMAMKVVNKKMTTIQDTLHPHIASEMIKEGINPLNLHIDELIERIEAYNNQYGEGIKDKLAQHIAEMQSTLSTDERAKMMAMYKSLNEITKFEGAALGINVKSGNSLTLGHLLDAANYYTKTGGKRSAIDLTSDHAYDIKKDTIRSLLAETAQAPTPENVARVAEVMEQTPQPTALDVNEAVYKDLLLKEAVAKLSPDVVQEMEKDQPLEQVLPHIKPATLAKADQIVKDLMNHAKDNEAAIHFLQKNNLPANGANIEAISKTITQPKQLKDRLNAIKDKLSKEAVEKVPAHAVDYLVGDTAMDVNAAMEELVYTEVKLEEVRMVQNAIHLQSQLAVGSYTLPVRIGGAVSTLHMHVQGVIDNTVTVAISLDVPAYGTVSAYVKTENGHVSLYLNHETPEQLLAFKENHDQLTALFKADGFDLTSVMYGEELVDNYNVSYETIKTTTRGDLFKMATYLTKFLEHQREG